MALAERPTLFPHDVVGPGPVRRDIVPGVEFHPAVAAWFERRFDQGPTAPQVQGWPHIAARQHTLISAPTGSGKTLAGFLMSINRLYVAHEAGIDISGTRVVYVSPLKALAVDIAENLEQPLREIAEMACEMGYQPPVLTTAIRTGDTPSSERQAMIRKPRTFMITTPESLYLLVTAAKSRKTLETVETVIVDEIHAMARDKRGTHLALTVERLDHVCASPPVRVGLSATQKPIETVAQMLVGTRTNSDGSIECAMVDVGHGQQIDVEIELPELELEAVASQAQMAQVIDRIADLVAEHHTTLVFVNTRRLAERLAHQLGERLGDEVVAAHHGSLSKDRRHTVERRLRAGDLKALVATASLELGIDVGPVELVCQIGSPRSIATFLQRVGRSNHTRNGIPKGRIYPLTRDELVECVALVRGLKRGVLDAVHPPAGSLDILAQQVVAETGAEDWDVDNLFDLIGQSYPYRDFSRADFDEVIELVSQGVMTGRGRRAAWVHHDEVNGEVRGRRGARFVALTSGGAIPEIYDMRVVAEPDDTFIGTVNEDWAMESMAGDIFLLGTNSWRIRQVSGGEVRVADAGDAPPSVPFWQGEAPARTVELSEEVSSLRHDVDLCLENDDPAGATSLLMQTAGIPSDTAALVVAYLAAGKAALGVMPTSTNLVMERFFDDADGMQLVIHSPLGGRINRAMGYALRKKFCVGFNFELQAAASDDAVVISLGPHHSFPLADVQHFLKPNIIAETLTQAVLDQPAFQTRWRWNLNRALLVLRRKGGKRNPPPIQRMESDDLMAALFPEAAACQENVTGPRTVPEHPIVRQTVHDTLTESLDVDGLVELWRNLESDSVVMHHVDTTEPSLLAHEILTARPYAFLDDAELPDRRTHNVALRRGLPVDLGNISSIDPDAIAAVQAEAAPDPRTPDELHDLLGDTVLLAAEPAWQPLFDHLKQRGRVGEISGRWHTTALVAEVEVITSGQATEDLFPEEIAATMFRGHLEMKSPATVEELMDATGVGATTAAVALATLESQGVVLQGRFTPQARSRDGEDAGPVEWCVRRLLARMHAKSRSTRRRSVQSATAEEFIRFLCRWQHVAPGTRLRSPAGLSRALEQLQGWEAAVAAWEPNILGARVADYRPAWIDTMCHNGEIQWLRLSPPPTANPDRRSSGPSKATPVSIVHREDLTWLLSAVRGDTQPPIPELGAVAEIAETLQRSGARFVSELATETRRLTSDIEAALWEGVARGLFTADGFEAVRALTSKARRQTRPTRSVSRLRKAGPRSSFGAGRWSLVPHPAPSDSGDLGDPSQSSGGNDWIAAQAPDRHDLAEAVADQLLQRWGVVFYDLVSVENLAVSWREIQWALRRLEDRGLVLGGRFVKGFSGEQFALREATEELNRVRKTPYEGATVTVSGADPLNLTSVIISGDRVPARRSTSVVLPV